MKEYCGKSIFEIVAKLFPFRLSEKWGIKDSKMPMDFRNQSNILFVQCLLKLKRQKLEN